MLLEMFQQCPAGHAARSDRIAERDWSVEVQLHIVESELHAARPRGPFQTIEPLGEAVRLRHKHCRNDQFLIEAEERLAALVFVRLVELVQRQLQVAQEPASGREARLITGAKSSDPLGASPSSISCQPAEHGCARRLKA